MTTDRGDLMTKSDFEILVGRKILESDFRLIERIHTFHPCIATTRQAVLLYKEFGISIFMDLSTRANEVQLKDCLDRINR
jgi:hypothetical protein